MPERSEFIRGCPYCTDGCSECSDTGQQVTTFMERPGGVVARIHGNEPLSPESAAALAAVVDAAARQMAAERCGMCGGSGVAVIAATDGEVSGRCWPCGGDGRSFGGTCS